MAILSPSNQVAAGPRLRWRVVVNSTPRKGVQGSMGHLAWHMADCGAPSEAEAHCPTGQEAIIATGNPEGHCLAEGVCPRCETLGLEAGIPPAATLEAAVMPVVEEVSPAPLN
jgi:hypothetical protein